MARRKNRGTWAKLSSRSRAIAHFWSTVASSLMKSIMRTSCSVAVMFAAWKENLSSSPPLPFCGISLVSLNRGGSSACMDITLSKTTLWCGASRLNKSDGENGSMLLGRRRWKSSMACSRMR